MWIKLCKYLSSSRKVYLLRQCNHNVHLLAQWLFYKRKWRQVHGQHYKAEICFSTDVRTMQRITNSRLKCVPSILLTCIVSFMFTVHLHVHSIHFRDGRAVAALALQLQMTATPSYQKLNTPGKLRVWRCNAALNLTIVDVNVQLNCADLESNGFIVFVFYY